MNDESERLHLEGLDEATERERWEEHFRPSDTEAVTLTEQIAELLAEHRFVYGRMVGQACLCGWHFITESEEPASDAHRAHVASILAARIGAGAQVTEAAVFIPTHEIVRQAWAVWEQEHPRPDSRVRNDNGFFYFRDGFDAAFRYMGTGQSETDALIAERDAYRDQSDEDQKRRGQLVIELEGAYSLLEEAAAENADLRARIAELEDLQGALDHVKSLPEGHTDEWSPREHLGHHVMFVVVDQALKKAEAERDDLRARISALADEWEADMPQFPAGDGTMLGTPFWVTDLRALLDSPAVAEGNET